MSGIQVTKLPETFFNPIGKALEVLNISDNAFQQVPEALLHMTSLKELNIDGNPFSALDDFT